MKKPIAVKIVEALGWAYVVLAALAGLSMTCDYMSDCGYLPGVTGVAISLVLIAMPVGMVLSLRRGARAMFLWPHSILSLVAVAALLLLTQMWIAVCILLVLSLVPVVLLSRPAASRWLGEVAGAVSGKYACMAVLWTVLWCIFLARTVSTMSDRRREFNAKMVAEAGALFKSMAQNAAGRDSGARGVDPHAYSNSTDFVQALCANSKDLANALGRYTNIWCIVENPPDCDSFPVLFTANIAPADMIRNDWRDRPLTCARNWGGECWGSCRKHVAFVWKNGDAGFDDPIYACPCSQKVLSELADTYVLTPTGRVVLVGKAASPDHSSPTNNETGVSVGI